MSLLTAVTGKDRQFWIFYSYVLTFSYYTHIRHNAINPCETFKTNIKHLRWCSVVIVLVIE